MESVSSRHLQAALRLPGEVLHYKSRHARESSPCGVSTLSKERQKVKRSQHINSSPFLLDGPLCAYDFIRPEQGTHCVFSGSRSQFPYAPLRICYFSTLTDFLITLAALELYPFLSSNISIYPCFNLCVLS